MRLFEDGFDHYGTDEANLLDGPYADNDCTLSTSVVSTGTHSVRITGIDNAGSSFSGLRKVLPSSTDKLGVAMRIYQPGLQTANYYTAICDFLTSDPNRSQVCCTLDANGALRFTRGNYYGFTSGGIGTLITQTDPIITANAWNHIEIQIYIHDTLGWIRVAVNGVHVFEETGLDTKYNSDEIVSVGFHNIWYGSSGATAGRDPYLDDLYIYDFTGDDAVETDFCPTTDAGVATSYIGDLQVMYLPVDGDTTQMDWVASTGTDEYAMVDETTPNDADYISATAVGDVSEFTFQDLPEDITYVRGVSIWGRMSKSDAGAANISYGTKSFDSVIDADERPVTTAATYWRDMANIDPNTGAATGTLTFTNQPADTETVVIDGKTYTFQTVLTNVDGNVLIGANLAATITNLAAAIDLGAGSGTGYAAATTLHPTVAATPAATTLTVTAKTAGTGGNSITTTETVANASWGGATLSGGDAGGRWTRATLNAGWLRLTRTV